MWYILILKLLILKHLQVTDITREVWIFHGEKITMMKLAWEKCLFYLKYVLKDDEGWWDKTNIKPKILNSIELLVLNAICCGGFSMYNYEILKHVEQYEILDWTLFGF